MKLRCLAAVVGQLLLFSIGSHAENIQHWTSICTVLANPTKFDGKRMLISGEYRMQPHGPIFFGKKCSKEEVLLAAWKHEHDDRDARATWEALLRNDESLPIHTIFRARFRITHGFVCNEVTCFRYELQDPELLAAAPAQ